MNTGLCHPKFDRRLVGTWVSDRRKTFEHFVPPRACTPENLRRFKRLFGKLRLRWGFTRVYTELNGFKSTSKYETIARDFQSVIVRSFNELLQEYELSQIYFEGSHYWVWASPGETREYFKRVK